MSDNVLSYGVMAKLIKPVGKYKTKEWQDMDNKLDEELSGLQLNYEGTIIYNDLGGYTESTYGINFIQSEQLQAFFEELQKAGIVADFESSKIYSCFWYNGADSYMSDITLKEFESI